MSKTLKALQQSVKAGIETGKQPVPEFQRYKIGERFVHCCQCNEEYFAYEALQTDLFCAMGLRCKTCGHMEFFAGNQLPVSE